MGFLSNFIYSTIEDIEKNQRARNIKALKTDPQLKKAEEDFSKAYDKIMKLAAERKAKYGF